LFSGSGPCPTSGVQSTSCPRRGGDPLLHPLHAHRLADHRHLLLHHHRRNALLRRRWTGSSEWRPFSIIIKKLFTISERFYNFFKIKFTVFNGEMNKGSMLSMKLILASRSGVGKGVWPFRSYLECSQAYLRGLRIHELLSNEGLSNAVLSKTLLSKAFYLYTTLGQTDLYLVSRGDTSLAWHPRHRISYKPS